MFISFDREQFYIPMKIYSTIDGDGIGMKLPKLLLFHSYGSATAISFFTVFSKITNFAVHSISFSSNEIATTVFQISRKFFLLKIDNGYDSHDKLINAVDKNSFFPNKQVNEESERKISNQ